MSTVKTRWVAIRLVLVACLVAGALFWIWDQQTRVRPVSRAMEERLMRNIVTSFSVENATVEQTVTMLNGIMEKQMPDAGVNLTIWEKRSLPRGVRERKHVATDLNANAQPLRERPITMTVSGASLYELLKYVSSLASTNPMGRSCLIGQQGNTLYLVDADGILGLVTRTYTVRADLIERLRADGPEHVLRGFGIEFEYPGSFAKLTPTGKLRICAAPEEHDLVEILIGMTSDPGPQSFLERLKQQWTAIWNR